MKRSNIFWGVMLVVLGGLFLLEQQKLVKDVWGLAVPLGLILAGALALVHRPSDNDAADGGFEVPLQNAARVDIDLDHGAGSVKIDGSAGEGQAMRGNNGAGLEKKIDHGANGLAIQLHAGPSFLPFLGPESGEWHFGLTPNAPITINLDAGAANLDLDLANLKVSFLKLQIGAANLKVQFPSAGKTLAEIESGMASQQLIIPNGMEARIRVEQGASTVNLDQNRFKPHGSSGEATLYQSDGFGMGETQLELNLKGGANTIAIE